ncbi:paraquat-inducible protein A [Paludibacterium yongneupense]|uniref:paraquat-inducible protein A n=1 Tax=Paludibacterium yongneupense TaxID=400061 RepID=UPI000410373A|nr:paraquat-inducible protein A [Paludibacterium yongneupense]
MHLVHGLIVCDECDSVYRKPDLRPGEAATCPRCGARLDRGTSSARRARQLPLTLAGLVVFVIANLSPIVTMEIQGVSNATTLWQAVLSLYRQGMLPISAAVFCTAILFPLTLLAAHMVLLWPNSQNRHPRVFALISRLMSMVRPWVMVEVLLLGILVAVVKLSHMAEIDPGVGLWAYGALTVLLACVLSSGPQEHWTDGIQA